MATAVGLVVWAMSDSIAFFSTPTDILANTPIANQRIRLGGLVEAGSVVRSPDGTVTFAVTDGASTVNVVYKGILPDLFRENSGVVTEGIVSPAGIFTADTVLARHDENYMPPEVAEALRRGGVWQGGGAERAEREAIPAGVLAGEAPR